jgi:uncharacterized membrane protein (UPF0127 family)
VTRENWQLIEAETGRILVAHLEIADTLVTQAIGLLGRSHLAPDTGLWIEPCNGIHTLAMRFPIDVLFLDKEGRALRLVSHLKPWRFCGLVRGARVVVELPAGTLVEKNIRQGARYERRQQKTEDSR